MSHFVVAVLGPDHESQLEPFYEQGDADDYFMERVEEDVDLDYYRNFLKEQRENILAEARTYFGQASNMTLADGTCIDLSNEQQVIKEFAALETIGDGRTFNRFKGYADLPPLDCDEDTLVEWMGEGCEKIDGKWKRVYHSNPNAKWDWYQVGGRWSGFLRVKPNTNKDNYGFGERSWSWGNTAPAEPFTADWARAGDIDWDGMRKEAEKEAAETFDKYEAVVKAHPEALTWEETRRKFLGDLEDEVVDRRHPKWEEFDKKIGLARTYYHQQPRVQALQAANLLGWMSGEEVYQVGREEFILRAGKASIAPFAILDHGTWSEKGEMGWFGMAHNEKPEGDWLEEVWKHLTNLPPDTPVTIVDCHI